LDRRVVFEAEVRTWVDRWALAELRESGPAQVDIDELFNPPPARAATAILECLDLATTFVGDSDVVVSGLVVIPLQVVEDQIAPPVDYPSLSETLACDWVYGPGREVPGLYLIHQGKEQQETDIEE
jgi:hypothetical protein